MRIPSGKTDIYMYFVAVDATDLVTRETGLSSFVVSRSRNGAAKVVMTTPTIAEIDLAYMPGVYALLLDEDTTIGSTSDNEEIVLHITHTGMAPVTRAIELYRRDTTSGKTALIDSSGRVDVAAVGGTAQTARDLGASVLVGDKTGFSLLQTFPTNFSALGISAGGHVSNVDTLTTYSGDTPQTGDAFGRLGAAGAGLTALGDTRVANLDAAVTSRMASYIQPTGFLAASFPTDPADASVISGRFDTLDASVADVPTNTELATALGTADDATLAAIAALNNISAAQAETAAGNALATYDAPTHAEMTAELALADDAMLAAIDAVPTAAENRAEIDLNSTRLAAIDSKTTNLPTDPADASVIAGRFDTLDASVADVPTNTELATALGTADDATLAQIALVKTKTDSLTFTVAGKVDSNITHVNETEVDGVGSDANPWGPV